MAYRIEPYVLRGEVDNRVRGRVTGRLWLVGVEAPVVLDLEGDAFPDLAGRLLTFQRKGTGEKGAQLSSLQRGEAGDLTASRKGRVLDVPVDEAMEMSRAGRRPPEHLANVLYLEWFSDANGRVVIEATDFELTVSAPEWEPGPADEAALRERAAGAFSRYVERLTRLLEEREHRGPESYEDWDEFDFERVLRESDARTDKLGELIDKFGDDAEAEERIAREMSWSPSGEPEGQGSDEGESAHETFPEFDLSSVEAERLEPDPLTEGVDWVRTAEGEISHPLVERCSDGAVRLWREHSADGRIQPDDPDLQLLLAEYQITTAKLAGALNGLAYGRGSQHPAFVVACLKRALGHLHTALGALAAVQERSLLDEAVAERVSAELFGIRESILGLMMEFRAR